MKTISNAITSAHLCAASSRRQSLPQSQNPPRTKDEALRDLDYLIRLNQRHRRLYVRLSASLRYAELLGGSLALTAVAGQPPWLLTLAGAGLALVGFAGFAFAPAERLVHYARALQQYSAVRAQAVGRPDMSLAELDRKCTAVEDPDYLEALRLPSHNDMMRSHGLIRALQPLTRWQRLLTAIA